MTVFESEQLKFKSFNELSDKFNRVFNKLNIEYSTGNNIFDIPQDTKFKVSKIEIYSDEFISIKIKPIKVLNLTPEQFVKKYGRRDLNERIRRTVNLNKLTENSAIKNMFKLLNKPKMFIEVEK